MLGWAIAFVFSLIFYLALTFGSGTVLFWSESELIAGAAFAIIAAILAKKIFNALGVKPSAAFLNPRRWLLFFIYLIGPFFLSMAKCNLDVAYRVITGKIRPGIVKIKPGLETDFGAAMLANSITLTPGTLTVDIDKEKNFYVHWIFVKNKDPKPEEICGSFPKWVRRIAE